MKPARFYKNANAARQKARSTAVKSKPDPLPVVIVSNNVAQPPSSPAAPPNIWSRLWAAGKIIGPASLSVAALIVSLLTYEDQHQVNYAAASANQRQQAELITFIQQPDWRSAGTIFIENNSKDPVSNAALLGYLLLDSASPPFQMGIYLGSIPACSIYRITSSMMADYLKKVSPLAFPDKVAAEFNRLPNAGYGLEIESLYFTDNSGASWEYPEGGPLEEPQPPLNRLRDLWFKSNGDVFVPGSYIDLTGPPAGISMQFYPSWLMAPMYSQAQGGSCS